MSFYLTRLKYIIFRNDRPTERSMAILIEIYLQFIQTLPVAITQELNGVV